MSWPASAPGAPPARTRFRRMCPRSPLSRSRHQVQERVQEDPDDVDEVPVERCDLEWSHRRGVDAPSPEAAQHECDQSEADDQMNGVSAGHHKVEVEEQSRPCPHGRLELEAEPRNEVLSVIVQVLERLE